MKSKGIAFNNLLLILLAMVTLILFSLFLYNKYADTRDMLAVQNCRNSIAAHSVVAKGTFSQIFTDVKCPTRDITLGKSQLKDSKRIIAEDMHRCWYEWGQGKEQLFQGDGMFCHICATYSFDEKGQKIDGFIQYLASTSMYVKYPGDTPGIKYLDYMNPYHTENAEQMVQKSNQVITPYDYINTSAQYTTIIVYASGKEQIQKFLEGGTRVTVGTIGGLALIAGSAGSAYIVGSLLLLSNPGGWVVLGTVALLTIGYEAVGLATNVKNPEWVSFMVFRPYNVDELSNLGCQKLEANQLSHAPNK